MTTLKMNIWEIRAKRDLTLRQLSKITGISRGRLNNIENNKSRPADLGELVKLDIALDTRILDLFESEYK